MNRKLTSTRSRQSKRFGYCLQRSDGFFTISIQDISRLFVSQCGKIIQLLPLFASYKHVTQVPRSYVSETAESANQGTTLKYFLHRTTEVSSALNLCLLMLRALVEEESSLIYEIFKFFSNQILSEHRIFTEIGELLLQSQRDTSRSFSLENANAESSVIKPASHDFHG